MGMGNVHYSATQQRYLIDLFVVADYNSNEMAWKSSFQYASDSLFEATHGQMQIGEVSFLNNGVLNANEDAVLQDTTVASVTNNYCLTRSCESEEFIGYMQLTQRAKHQPLETTHELGHYVGCLGDEYRWATVGTCGHDASTHRCIMEYAYGYSVKLDSNGNELPASEQPTIRVTEFCDSVDHLNCLSDSSCTAYSCSLFNSQQQKHGHSCWETWIDHFCEMKLPGDPSLPQNTPDPIDWTTRVQSRKFGFNVIGTSTFVNQGVIREIKNASNAWASLVAGTGNQIGFAFDFSDDSKRKMGAVKLEELDELISMIDSFGPEKSKAQPPAGHGSFLGIDQFSGKTGAWQFIILAAPGNYLAPSLKGKPDTDWNAVIQLLEQKKIQLLATTIGPGELARQLDLVQSQSRWVRHVVIPPDPDNASLHGFDFQNHLVDLFFLKSPGYGMTSVRSGVLPNLPLKPANHVVQGKKEREPFLPFRFEPRAEGIDHTVFVESDAEGAFFILSEPERQDLEFSLLGPKGQTINRETQASPALRMSSEKENVSWFAVSGDIGGQWILRASRKSEGANKPFQLFAGIKNDAIFLRTRIVVESNCVKFNCTTHHGEPLDFVNTVVDIYRADEYPRSESPLRSIVLQRQQNRHPVFKRNVPVSTGGYYGETNLDPGNFVAEFLVSNPGTAVSANNPGGFPLGDLTETKQRTIPVFTRMDRKHFRVSKDALQATSG